MFINTQTQTHTHTHTNTHTPTHTHLHTRTHTQFRLASNTPCSHPNSPLYSIIKLPGIKTGRVLMNIKHSLIEVNHKRMFYRYLSLSSGRGRREKEFLIDVRVPKPKHTLRKARSRDPRSQGTFFVSLCASYLRNLFQSNE